MHARRTIAIVALSLVLAQTLVIARCYGTSIAVVGSDLVQILIGILCMIASLRARSAVGKASSRHWMWLAVSFGGFISAQSVGTYIDISSNHTCDKVDDVLFSLSVIPIAMLPFVDPDREPGRFDRLHVFDFLLVSCFWASVYLYFVDTPGIALATVGWEGFGWSASLVFDAVLTLSFLLRVFLGTSTPARYFFGGMAIYVFQAGLADAYAALPANDVQPGHWFDLIWSFTLATPLVIALTWSRDVSLAPHPDRAERIVSHHLFPLVYPFFAILFLVQDARRTPSLSTAIAMIVFAALAMRILITQRRLFHTQETLQFEASHDALTGVSNRAAILQTLEKEIGRHHRNRQPLTVMLADIDHFKNVNDTYGHLVGDQVLTEVVGRLTASIRIGDTIGRFGGEEFLIVLPDCNTAGAVAAGERFRAAIAGCPIPTTAGPVSVAISAGGVCTSEDDILISPTVFLRSADAALYKAKADGRNRVVVSDPMTRPASNCPAAEAALPAH